MKIIITGACAVSARSVARSLRKSEIFGDSEIVGWDMGRALYAFYEGVFDRIYKVPPVSSPDYRVWAQKILAKEKPDLVIAVPEVEVLYWSQNPFEGVKCLLPPPKFCELAISKDRLFRLLDGEGLVPRTRNITPAEVLRPDFDSPIPFPAWIRDCAAGTASGEGSLKVCTPGELKAWVWLNSKVESFQLSEYLSGGNFGCMCLFKNGRLVKLCAAERIEYVMSKVAVSGVTGNTSVGRLLNDERIKQTALRAIDAVCSHTGETMNGLVVVDMKADESGKLYVTEINIRHVAFSSSFASAGFNMSEYQSLLALDKDSEVPSEVEKTFPEGNLILRDIDGLPIYVESHRDLNVGDCM